MQTRGYSVAPIPRLPRSILYTPAFNLERLQGAREAGADVCLIDLEDSVPPARKALAREHCLQLLKAPASASRVAVRINELRSPQGLLDLEAFIRHGVAPDIVMLTMVRDACELEIVRAQLSELKHPVELYVTVETLEAIDAIDPIASQCSGLVFGSADFAAELGVEIGWENMLYARQRIANAAARYDIAAIDTACYHLDDPQLLLQESRAVKALGFHGKAIVHPRQLATVMEVFSPSPGELERAREILRRAEHSQGEIFTLDGDMIGPPFIKKARKLLNNFTQEPHP
ncbi:CoA ester lyase [Pseudomonas sp. B21-059]|uniref:HpcH/HpaI aldolase/citrate lyase family protein n=1 Tax=Pseudomonas sp. B21-059 TaxID=2895496 RepID=UPI002233ED2A|nr:CoA ester lyase [Pseudomonas sp. B21-059]UZE36373.1 CoA ester lyase [Pseudomonas sp. B21-059]